MPDNRKIAIVYDWLDKWGGVERVLLTLHEMFPKAVFYTSHFNKAKAAWAKDLEIKTSFIQKLSGFIRENRILSLPFYPFAFESFDFKDFDLVISVTSSFAKSVITLPKTKHICLLLTPTRFLWSHLGDYIGNWTHGYLVNGYVEKLRSWDLVASQRPDKIISISETARERCKRYYGRESEVVYPPFDTEYWQNIKSKVKSQMSKVKVKSQKYFLVVSRLESYKKVDLAIEVFNKMKKNLIIVGEGREESKLKRLAGENIEFRSNISDEELGNLYANAEGLIMPQEEDFGYVSLEAQFFGCPVISFKKGGAKETVVEGKTGIFFDKQTERDLRQVIERYSRIKYNLRRKCDKEGELNVSRFDKKVFVRRLLEVLS